jgi:hypothetical protein
MCGVLGLDLMSGCETYRELGTHCRQIGSEDYFRMADIRP